MKLCLPLSSEIQWKLLAIQDSQGIERSLEILTESFRSYWEAFVESVPGILLALLIMTAGYMIANKIGNLTRRGIARRSNDPLMSKFLGSSIKILLVLFALTWALQAAGLRSITNFLFTSLGASALIVGFAFKDIGENFLAGIILAFNRPFNINDTVEMGQYTGRIQALEFRYTKIKTFDGRDVYIPNSHVLKNPVVNYTEDGFFRNEFTVRLALDSDAEKAESIIQEVLDSQTSIVQSQSHENYVTLSDIDSKYLYLRVYFWVETVEFRRKANLIKGDVINQVKTVLLQKGFKLPNETIEIIKTEKPS
ncbi:MAG: mechanosensitive ion channel family protein [Weeksellaceae bacterium]|nr:mechanosensitive ion channel family protein [Weeksellaceae bacterium]